MSPFRTAAIALVLASAAAAPAFAAPLTVSVAVGASASVEVASRSFTFDGANGTDARRAATENPGARTANVRGIVRTSRFGTGTIGVVVPGTSLTGSAGTVVPLESVRMSCATADGNGGRNAIPSELASLTPLIAGAVTPCATYGGGTTAQVALQLALFLDVPNASGESFVLDGLAVVASAT